MLEGCAVTAQASGYVHPLFRFGMGGSFHLAFEHSRMVFCKPTLHYSTSTAEACHFVSHKLPALQHRALLETGIPLNSRPCCTSKSQQDVHRLDIAFTSIASQTLPPRLPTRREFFRRDES